MVKASNRQWRKRWLSTALALAMAALSAPAVAVKPDPAGGLRADTLPCSPPLITYYVFSTSVDLSRSAGHFVALRGTVQPGNCAVNLFEVKKATIEPDISCPCPAASLDLPATRGAGMVTAFCPAGPR